MFDKFFRRLLEFGKQCAAVTVSQPDDLDQAEKLMALGDKRAAIEMLREHLKSDPCNVAVLNNLGTCLADTGNLAEAESTFELAFSLDDSYMPAVVNHAKMLIDRQRSAEGMRSLLQAKVCEPDFSHVDAVYAGLTLVNGDASKATQFQLKAWLANFDNLRMANCYLFYSSYADQDEAKLAAEHRFWAETARPIDLISNPELMESQALELPEAPSGTMKIRIGYWSPDFRNHSVRYFFRPLLEGHDLNKFEIFLYHDFLTVDAQTELMRAVTPNFYQVDALTDADLHALVLSHKLDVFVELAGHSSHNRLPLLQHRFATAQISALGYPPTTGLRTVDAKLLDRHVVTPSHHRYYAESPLVMPSSFWCFDPMEDAPITPEPPVTRNGYITFACVGNIAKINARMLRCWKEVLERVDKSRLLIRAINFNDSAVEDTMRARLEDAGISLNRVDLRKAEGGAAFFGSYNEIDIILDTFPFNGGTTTCFATYMGVPVVSLSGASLVSRMGLSILSNLSALDMVVSSEEAYVERAVILAQDVAYLRQFRQEVRARFQQSCLGNGKLFAQEFETVCIELIDKKMSQTLNYQNAIELLPADEIVRRAYAVLNHGQADAAHRILSHCLEHYPNSGGAHLLIAQQWTGVNRYNEASAYLEERLGKFDEAEKAAALIYLTRLYLLLGQEDNVRQTITRLSSVNLEDVYDQLQVNLYSACCGILGPPVESVRPLDGAAKRIKILIPCDNPDKFNGVRRQIEAECGCPDGWTVAYQRCDESSRIAAYSDALRSKDADILLIAQKNIEIYNPRFFIEVVEALKDCDVLGVAGATRWQRMDWRFDDFVHKAAGYLVESSEQPGYVELQWQGGDRSRAVHNMVVLDGSLLALEPVCMQEFKFDEELLGADLLLEEDWSHTASQMGKRLAVHRNLGVLIRQPSPSDTRDRAAGRMRITEKYKFDVFTTTKNDTMFVSAPIASASEAVRVGNIFLEKIE